eukprot:14397504-Alexandrium_andersonii.AAC.1
MSAHVACRPMSRGNWAPTISSRAQAPVAPIERQRCHGEAGVQNSGPTLRKHVLSCSLPRSLLCSAQLPR